MATGKRQISRFQRTHSSLKTSQQETPSNIYRVRQIKVIPCRVLLISQQRTGIFITKFTRLFAIHIYVQLLNYIKQDTCSNEHEVCPMPLHKYEAQ